MTSKIWYNSISKTYLDGSKQIIIATNPIFRIPGMERIVLRCSCTNTVGDSAYNLEKKMASLTGGNLEKNVDKALEIVEMSVGQLEELDAKDRANLDRSMRRARVKVRDFCLSTPMVWFVTLTVDGKKAPRYDVVEMTRRLNVWLNNMVKRKGLAYVMIPELHKDGAIHYHALMTDNIETEDSGTIIPRIGEKPRRPCNAKQRNAWLQHGGKIVYNLPEWPYGFTTAVKLSGNYEHAVNYVCKYITKGHDVGRVTSKVGGRWYYHGGKLGKPVVEYFDSDYEEIVATLGDAAHVVDVSDRLSGVRLAVLWQCPNGEFRVERRLAR